MDFSWYKFEHTFEILEKVVEGVDGKPGWAFDLRMTKEGLRMVISDMKCIDAYTGKPMPLSHFFPVPPTTFNEASWRRWVFECCRGVENHELGEWIRWDEERPFAPLHGPGEDPYTVHEIRPIADALTTQDGTMRIKS